MNFAQLKTDFDKVNVSINEEVSSAVAHFAKSVYTSKRHFYAVLCLAMKQQGVVPEAQGTPWDEMTEDQRTMRTIYSQVIKQLGLV